MRRFEETHPWITFDASDVNRLEPIKWMLLGECRSKCEHLAGAPLQPSVAHQLYQVTLVKGAQATTAIEGNTLSEDQVQGILDGSFQAPPSRAYQEREVRNVLDALQEIDDQIMRGEIPVISAELIKSYNARLLDGTEYEDEVVPGEVRQHSVGVANYRGAPAEDCEYLIERLAEWLESDTFRNDDPLANYALAVAAAIYAHLYIAWIHPFGDGNGRTARLLEFLILARCGMVPLPAAHLLSNHYNLTRTRYYRELQVASATRKTTDFIAYAVEGLADGLREQIESVRSSQYRVTWINFVHARTNEFPSNQTRDRQRKLVLGMPPGQPIDQELITDLSSELARLYSPKGPRTLVRDLNKLEKAGLVRKLSGRRWIANDSIVSAFLPPMADGDV